MMSIFLNMNSTNNNSFEIAAKKVFSDLHDLIIEDEKEYKFDLSKCQMIL